MARPGCESSGASRLLKMALNSTDDSTKLALTWVGASQRAGVSGPWNGELFAASRSEENIILKHYTKLIRLVFINLTILAVH